ncbi:MAG: hypothetical protein AAF039_09730 [Bacteroidota bacterium]
MVRQFNFSLCLDDSAATVFCEPLGEVERMDNNEVIELIFSLFIQDRTAPDAIFNKSIDNLIESDCIEYMVYRYPKEQNRLYEPGDNWSVVMEINEASYNKLHPDICGKLREFYRNSPRKRRINYNSS